MGKSLAEWVFEAQNNYERIQKRRVNDEEFAGLVGISRGYLSQIRNGRQTKLTPETVHRFYALTGDIEIYEITGIDPPHPAVEAVKDILEEASTNLTEEALENLRQRVKSWVRDNQAGLYRVAPQNQEKRQKQ